MGQDYAARKSAKRYYKKLSKESAELGDKQKRERKKKNAPRRLCTGMCYKSPDLALTEDAKISNKKYENLDLEEYSHEDVDEKQENAVVRKERSNQDEKANHKKHAVKASSKMSTKIQLLAPSSSTQDRNREVSVDTAAFDEFERFIKEAMQFLGFAEPTPIQRLCWPTCCEGKDLKGIAEPGSGKTLAYLLPAYQRILQLHPSLTTASPAVSGPFLLVLLPTRELALQVAQQSKDLKSVTSLRTVCVYGGVDKDEQVKELDPPPHVLAATPGRLLDLVDSGIISLKQLDVIVLDEADRMLSIGFAPQLERLRSMVLPDAQPVLRKRKAAAAAGDAEAEAGILKAKRRPQVLLFSATMPDDVAETAAKWCQDPVTVAARSGPASVSTSITQVVHVCAEHKKPAKLLKHLDSIKASAVSSGLRNPPRVLVFANRIKTVRFLVTELAGQGWRVAGLHGEMPQGERETAMRDFRNGKTQILVSTDVASRGLDIRNLLYVVNYDFPSRLETYIHRVGRTGRLAAHGHAYSFFTRNLAKIAAPLVELLTQHNQLLDPNLLRLADAWKEACERLGLSAEDDVATELDEREGSPEEGAHGLLEDGRGASENVPEDLTEGIKLQETGPKKKKRKVHKDTSKAQKSSNQSIQTQVQAEQKRQASTTEIDSQDNGSPSNSDSDLEDVQSTKLKRFGIFGAKILAKRAKGKLKSTGSNQAGKDQVEEISMISEKPANRVRDRSRLTTSKALKAESAMNRLAVKLPSASGTGQPGGVGERSSGKKEVRDGSQKAGATQGNLPQRPSLGFTKANRAVEHLVPTHASAQAYARSVGALYDANGDAKQPMQASDHVDRQTAREPEGPNPEPSGRRVPISKSHVNKIRPGDGGNLRGSSSLQLEQNRIGHKGKKHSDEDSDSDEPRRKGVRKALPGRIRKKFAKLRAQKEGR